MNNDAALILRTLERYRYERLLLDQWPTYALEVSLKRRMGLPAIPGEGVRELLKKGLLHKGHTVNQPYYQLMSNQTKEQAMNEFEKVIKAHLDQRAANDKDFAAKYTPESEDKKRNITACCNYIIAEVKKSGRQGFSDDEVFGMAVHFYDESIEGPTTAPKCKIVVNHEIELSEAEKNKLREQARKEAEEAVIRAEKEKIRQEQEAARKKAEAQAKREAERAAAKKAAEEEMRRKRQEEFENGGLLFNFEEGQL